MFRREQVVMMNSQARQASWNGWGRKLALAAPLGALGVLCACGAPARGESPASEEPPAPPPAASSQPSTPSSAGDSTQPSTEPSTPAGLAPVAGSGEEPSADSAAELEELAGQVGSLCGAALDRCTAIDGCEQILACAAEHGCTGALCYCADARCEAPGPCRSVIDGAPGASSGAAAGGNRGPAVDAAAAVGACIEELFGAASGAFGAG